jgi:hypothetical protein
MPFVRIDLRRGKSADYRKALGDIVYQAMRDVINVPENDKFQVITEHADSGGTARGVWHTVEVQRRNVAAFPRRTPSIDPTCRDVCLISHVRVLMTAFRKRVIEKSILHPRRVFEGIHPVLSRRDAALLATALEEVGLSAM